MRQWDYVNSIFQCTNNRLSLSIIRHNYQHPGVVLIIVVKLLHSPSMHPFKTRKLWVHKKVKLKNRLIGLPFHIHLLWQNRDEELKFISVPAETVPHKTTHLQNILRFADITFTEKQNCSLKIVPKFRSVAVWAKTLTLRSKNYSKFGIVNCVA